MVESPDQYEVSNYGDIKRLERNFIDAAGRHLHYPEHIFWSEDQYRYGGTHGEDYLGVNINGNKRYAHRLAAEAFIINLENKPEINHKDGKTDHNYCGCAKCNYTDSNLEWVTHKENMEHASANGLINHESVLRKYQCKKNRENIDYNAMKRPILQLDLNGNVIQEFDSLKEAGKAIKISVTAIGSVARHEGYHKTAGGYNWVYKEEFDNAINYMVNIDRNSGSRKPIVQKTLEGQYIAEYNSIQEACKITGFSGSSYIGQCCAGKRKCYKGYKWEYKTA